ncbi:PspC domain-containing protein [Furfurilactobacillus sp. WILCCON 0119]|uniref:PspC domain-containing protein n=1 Tax=Furfurilactobacillus entadae TaxID=2922307 RepID=UPI0035EB6A67
MKRAKLTKSRTDRWIGGVFGGLGAYLHINATVLRIGYLLLAIFLPPHFIMPLLAIVLYGVLLWTIPSADGDNDAATFNVFGDLFSGQSRSERRGRKEIHAEERDVHDKHDK